MSESRLHHLRPYGQSLLRIVAGFVSMQYGLNKLLGLWMPVIKVGTLLWYAGWIEAAGGALMIVGLFTVPVAFIMSGEMAAAYFLVHARGGVFVPAKNMGGPAVLLCFIYFYFIFAGAGPLSLDHVVFRRRRFA